MMSACALGGNPGLRLPSTSPPSHSHAHNQAPHGAEQSHLNVQSLLSAFGTLGLTPSLEIRTPPTAQLDGSILDVAGRRDLLEDAAAHQSSEVGLHD
jgi:hypothetical protein